MKDDKVYEGEVHDMNDMGKKSESRDLQGASPIWKALSIVVALLAVAYDLSPIDAVPDTIPVLGWMDDIGITLMAALNAYQQFAKNQDALTVKLAKYVKWMLVALVVIAGVAVGGLVALIVHLVAQG